MNRDPEYVRDMLRLYAVTDRRWLGSHTLEEQVEQAILGGATCVQLREKDLPRNQFYTQALVLRALCSRYGVPLIINDDVEIALAVKADGVHIGQRDMCLQDVRKRAGDSLIIGVTAKTVEQALAAQADGADYLGSGAVFGTATKQDALPMSLELLGRIARSVSIPVVAIGGIDEHNIGRLVGTGVAGAAVVSGIFASQNIEETCRILRAQAEQIVKR